MFIEWYREFVSILKLIRVEMEEGKRYCRYVHVGVRGAGGKMIFVFPGQPIFICTSGNRFCEHVVVVELWY